VTKAKETNNTLHVLDETRRQWVAANRGVPDAMEFAYVVIRAQQYLVSYFEELLTRIDLTWSRFECLVALYYSPNDQLGLKTVSERLGVHQTTITYAVDQLERQGLIARVDHPEDRRRKLATLTPSGRAKVEQAFDLLEATEFGCGGLSTNEQARAAKLLRRLLASEPPPIPSDHPELAGSAPDRQTVPGRVSRGGSSRRER